MKLLSKFIVLHYLLNEKKKISIKMKWKILMAAAKVQKTLIFIIDIIFYHKITARTMIFIHSLLLFFSSLQNILNLFELCAF